MSVSASDLAAPGQPTTPAPRPTQQSAPIRVLLLDDRALMRAGVASVLVGNPAIGEVHEAATVEAAIALLDTHELDVVIASGDDSNPVLTNQVLCTLARHAGSAHVVCLCRSGLSTPPACGRFSAIHETAVADRLLQIVDESGRAAAQQQSCVGAAACAVSHTHLRAAPELTGQEARVLALLTEGLSNREIAARLNLAEKTVKNYVTRVLTKLGVASRTAAVAAVRDRLGRELPTRGAHPPR